MSDSFTANDREVLMAVAQTKDAAQGTCEILVAGQKLIADWRGVAYWPAANTLIVADLHLEKGSSFARGGQFLPPYDTMSTLKRLVTCIDKWQPARVIALGDSFHDAKASQRLPLPAIAQLQSLIENHQWIWITGNHDPEPPANLGGTVLKEHHEKSLTFRHEPIAGEAVGEIAGHLHPKARLVRRGRNIRRSCFAVSTQRMILPSFGAYTGGLDVMDKAFDNLFEAKKFHALMRGDGQIYKIPARELR